MPIKGEHPTQSPFLTVLFIFAFFLCRFRSLSIFPLISSSFLSSLINMERRKKRKKAYRQKRTKARQWANQTISHNNGCSVFTIRFQCKSDLNYISMYFTIFIFFVFVECSIGVILCFVLFDCAGMCACCLCINWVAKVWLFVCGYMYNV